MSRTIKSNLLAFKPRDPRATGETLFKHLRALAKQLTADVLKRDRLARSAIAQVMTDFFDASAEDEFLYPEEDGRVWLPAGVRDPGGVCPVSADLTDHWLLLGMMSSRSLLWYRDQHWMPELPSTAPFSPMDGVRAFVSDGVHYELASGGAVIHDDGTTPWTAEPPQLEHCECAVCRLRERTLREKLGLRKETDTDSLLATALKARGPDWGWGLALVVWRQDGMRAILKYMSDDANRKRFLDAFNVLQQCWPQNVEDRRASFELAEAWLRSGIRWKDGAGLAGAHEHHALVPMLMDNRDSSHDFDALKALWRITRNHALGQEYCAARIGSSHYANNTYAREQLERYLERHKDTDSTPSFTIGF